MWALIAYMVIVPYGGIGVAKLQGPIMMRAGFSTEAACYQSVTKMPHINGAPHMSFWVYKCVERQK
jgi:hypothetical protein